MDKNVFLAPLEELKALADSLPNTPMLSQAKINALVVLNMQYESVLIDKALTRHPYELAREFICHASATLRAWEQVGFAEGPDAHPIESKKSARMETKHHDLFQDLWTRFNKAEYDERIERYVHRLKINNLFDGFLSGKRCVDFGCGHGNFAHALVRAGATSALGIDFGENSIKYANEAKKTLGESRVSFQVASVYEVPVPDGSFDFAVQNGVFHHVDDEDAAIREMHRVLKIGGHIWYYTDGEGAINHDLWDASLHILRGIPHTAIIEQLERLNLSTGKRYHLGDGLNATYRHTSWEEITERLGRFGFGNFRRITGGFPTDFDHDAIASHRFGKEKFGSGDLRLIAEKLR